jgi:hypothetical protein
MAIFTVQRGKRYRAIIALGLIEQFADNATIASKLRDAGFSDVHVSGAGAKRTAEAMWVDDDASAALPHQIRSVVEIA